MRVVKDMLKVLGTLDRSKTRLDRPWAACPSEGRRRLRGGNAASEVVSDHTGPFGQGWRELEPTHCRMQTVRSF